MNKVIVFNILNLSLNLISYQHVYIILDLWDTYKACWQSHLISLHHLVFFYLVAEVTPWALHRKGWWVHSKHTASYSNVCCVPETLMPVVNKEEACMLEKREQERGLHMPVLVRVSAVQTERTVFLFLGWLECTQSFMEGKLDNKQHCTIHTINIHLLMHQIASKIERHPEKHKW